MRKPSGESRAAGEATIRSARRLRRPQHIAPTAPAACGRHARARLAPAARNTRHPRHPPQTRPQQRPPGMRRTPRRPKR